MQVNAQTSRHLSVSSQAYPPPVLQPYPHLHPELPPRFPRRPPGEAFNSAATSHRSGDECIFHPSGVCSLRSCGPRGVCRDWTLRATCRSRHLPPCGLVYRPGKKQRLWVLAPGPRQRCTQAVQKERTGEHWADARPPAPSPRCQLQGAYEMAGGPEEQGAAGLMRHSKSRCPPAGSDGGTRFPFRIKRVFSFFSCLADGELFKLDVEILN